MGEDDPSPWAKWDKWAKCGGNWNDSTGKEDNGRLLAGEEGPPAIERLNAGDGTREASSTSTFGSAIMAASSKLPVRLLSEGYKLI